MKSIIFILIALMILPVTSFAASTWCIQLTSGNVCFNNTLMTGTKLNASDILNLPATSGVVVPINNVTSLAGSKLCSGSEVVNNVTITNSGLVIQCINQTGSGGGSTNLTAANVTGGTFGSGAFTFPTNLTVFNFTLRSSSNLTNGTNLRCDQIVQTGAGSDVDFCTDSTGGGGGADGNNYTDSILFERIGTLIKLNLSRVQLANLTANFTDQDSASGGITIPASNVTNATSFTGNYRFDGWLNVTRNITMAVDEGCIWGYLGISHICMDEANGLHVGYHALGFNPTHTVYTGSVIQEIINGIEIARWDATGLNISTGNIRLDKSFFPLLGWGNITGFTGVTVPLGNLTGTTGILCSAGQTITNFSFTNGVLNGVCQTTGQLGVSVIQANITSGLTVIGANVTGDLSSFNNKITINSANITNGLTVVAANVTNGTFSSGLWTFNTNLTVNQNFTVGTAMSVDGQNNRINITGQTSIGQNVTYVLNTGTEICENFIGTQRNYSRCFNSTGHLTETFI